MVLALHAFCSNGTSHLCPPLLPGALLRDLDLWIYYGLDVEKADEGSTGRSLRRAICGSDWAVYLLHANLLGYGGAKQAVQLYEVVWSLESHRLSHFTKTGSNFIIISYMVKTGDKRGAGCDEVDDSPSVLWYLHSSLWNGGAEWFGADT